jgi:hypothetical protein
MRWQKFKENWIQALLQQLLPYKWIDQHQHLLMLIQLLFYASSYWIMHHFIFVVGLVRDPMFQCFETSMFFQSLDLLKFHHNYAMHHFRFSLSITTIILPFPIQFSSFQVWHFQGKWKALGLCKNHYKNRQECLHKFRVWIWSCKLIESWILPFILLQL